MSKLFLPFFSAVSHAHASYRHRHATICNFAGNGVAPLQETEDRRPRSDSNSFDIDRIEILRDVYQTPEQLRVLRHVVSK